MERITVPPVWNEAIDALPVESRRMLGVLTLEEKEKSLESRLMFLVLQKIIPQTERDLKFWKLRKVKSAVRADLRRERSFFTDGNNVLPGSAVADKQIERATVKVLSTLGKMGFLKDRNGNTVGEFHNHSTRFRLTSDLNSVISLCEVAILFGRESGFCDSGLSIYRMAIENWRTNRWAGK